MRGYHKYCSKPIFGHGLLTALPPQTPSHESSAVQLRELAYIWLFLLFLHIN